MKWSREIRKQLGVNCCSTRRTKGAFAALVITVVGLIYITDTLKVNETNPTVTMVHQAEPTVTVHPSCEPNNSVYNIEGFINLTTNIQTYLLYRHCRHFPMLLDSPRKCERQKDQNTPVLLLAIKSFPTNYERREVLRRTWASERLQNGMLIRTVFLLGTTGERFEKERLNSMLVAENQTYQDILQWNFTESFYNLTLKQVLFMEWLERSCPNLAFLFNGDDDVFVHSDNIVAYLDSLNDPTGDKHLFIGKVLVGSPTVQNPRSKYYVPAQVFAEEVYPPYCSGGGYLYSRFTASTIYQMSKNISLIPIDDAYMGTCLQQAGLSPMSHVGVWPLGMKIPSLDGFDPCYYRNVILVHKFQPIQIYILWNEVHRKDLICSKATHIQ